MHKYGIVVIENNIPAKKNQLPEGFRKYLWRVCLFVSFTKDNKTSQTQIIKWVWPLNLDQLDDIRGPKKERRVLKSLGKNENDPISELNRAL